MAIPVRRAAALALALVVCAPPLVAQQSGAVGYAGRLLSDALRVLESRGLRIIYSSESVRPDMRVAAEPRSTAPRQQLDELLAPHGLMARSGPAGSLLIVKDPRFRPRRNPIAERPPPNVTSPGATDAGEPTRFAETITVAEVDPSVTMAGPPALSPQTLDARTFAGSFDNIFRTLQALPGIAAAEELGGRLAVRGGGPDQNLTVLDGVEVHNPHRLFLPAEDLGMVGMASMFNPETTDRFELFPGAFDVRYGDRLSSLLVVSTRDGSNAEAFQGFASVSVAEANVVLEGRLPERSNGSWLIGARRTYFDLIAEPVIGTTLPSFNDVQTKLTFHPRSTQRITFLGIAGRERARSGGADTEERRALKTDNLLAALTFYATLGSRATSKTVASYSALADAIDAGEQSFDNSRGANTAASIAGGGLLRFQLARDVGVRDLSVRQEWTIKPVSTHWLDAGAEWRALDTRWRWRISGDRSQHQPNGSSIRLGNSLPGRLDSTLATSRFGAWLQDRWQVTSSLALQPGIRIDRASLTTRPTMSPRLGATLRLGRATRLDAGFRLHAQSPGYEKVLQSDYFLDLSGGRDLRLEAERAAHAVVGAQRDFGGVRARIDAYYKRYTDLIVGRIETEEQQRERLSGIDVPPALWPSVSTRPAITTTPVNGATGRAYGVDTSVSYSGPSPFSMFTGWAGYSFARADRTAYGLTRPFDYDRRHALTMVANMKLSPRLDLSATGRWASGFPRTPVSGVQLALTADTADADGDGNRAEHIPLRDAEGFPMFQPDLGGPANINAARLPHYARLDARLAYRPSWGGDRSVMYLDFVNLLNARNFTQVDTALRLNPGSDRPVIIEVMEDRGLPIFASFGIRIWF